MSCDVGNGGLSLRRKSKMVEILDNRPDDNHYEDYYFSLYHNQYKPTINEAQLFSVETFFSPISFGMHKACLYIAPDELLELSKHMPKIYELQQLCTS